jgi:hypothetical protein
MAWTAASLRERVGHVTVDIEVTPTGLGDTIVRVGDEDLFVMPETQSMRLSDFLDDAAGATCSPMERNVRFLYYGYSSEAR